jgi:hypothetical protein
MANKEKIMNIGVVVLDCVIAVVVLLAAVGVVEIMSHG